MQTFLPFPNFKKSTSVLCRLRLGKERLEVLQMLKAIHDPSADWQRHPAVNMWRPYVPALVTYGLAICDEWIVRGYRDTTRPKIFAYATDALLSVLTWLADDRLHHSHRASLLAKNPDHYEPLFRHCRPPQHLIDSFRDAIANKKPLPYWWPTN